MKHLYTAILLFIAALSASAESYRSVAVNLTDGSKVDINLSDDLSASFSGKNLVVTGTDCHVSVPRSAIKSFTFSTTVGISTVGTTDLNPKISGGIMTFTGLPAATPITVYDTNGMQLFHTIAEGDYSLMLSSLNSPVLLVKVNDVVYKISSIR